MEETKQTIILRGAEESVSFGIHASSVDIIASLLSCIESSDKRASNALIVSPTVSYDWEYNYYTYSLVACHESGYIAYFLKAVDGSPAVRLMKQDSATHCLLKFSGGNLTVKFSHSNLPLLAVLSFDGILKIFCTNETTTDPVHLLISLSLLKDVRNFSSAVLEWGPKLLRSAACVDMDQSLILAIALNEKVFLLDLNQLMSYYIDCPLMEKDEIEYSEDFISKFGSSKGWLKNCFLELFGNSNNVHALAFSNDCNIFATGSQDGKVSVYHSDYSGDNSMPFHEWYPHSNLSISSLFIVDYKSLNSPSGYFITGGSSNRELRLWRGHDYSLVQSVNFRPTDVDYSSEQTSAETVLPQLILCFDSVSRLLLASDVKRSVLYTLDLGLPPIPVDGDITFRCVNEFLLMHPCISFDASWVSRENLSQEYTGLVTDEDDFQNCEKIEFSLALMHQKMLQTGRLSYFVPSSIMEPRDDFNPSRNALEPPTSLEMSSDIYQYHSPGDPSKMTTVEHEGAPSPFVNENCDSRTIITEASSISTLKNCFEKFNVEVADEESLFIKSSKNSLHGDLGNVVHPSPSNSEEILTTIPALGSPHLLTNPFGLSTPKATSLLNESLRYANLQMSVSPPSPESLSQNSKSRRQSRSLKKSFSSDPSVHAMMTDPFIPGLSHIYSKTPGFLAESRASSQVTALAAGKFPRGELSDSVRSLMGSCSSVECRNSDSVAQSTVGDSASASLFQQSYPIMQNSHQVHPSLLNDLLSSMKTLIQDSKAQSKTISTLMNKIQDNKTLLTKVLTTQNVILNHLSSLSSLSSDNVVADSANTAAVGDVGGQSLPYGIVAVPPPIKVSTEFISPPWVSQLMEELRSQKAYNTKRLTQFENTIKNISTPKKTLVKSSDPQASNISDSETSINAKYLTEQIRSILRNELQVVFRSNMTKIVDPLRQCILRAIDETVKPLPIMVTNHIMRVINDPKFIQFLSGNISTAISSNMSNAYREELRRTLIPAFTSGIEKLLGDLDFILKSGFQQHLSSIFSQIHDGTTTSKEKIDAATKLFDNSINKLSKELPSIISSKIVDALPQIPKSASYVEPISRGDARKASFDSQPALRSAATQPPHSSSSSSLHQQSFKPKPSDSEYSGAYWNAVSSIRSGLFAQALETALTTTNQSILLRVLQELSVVHLFRQNVGQDLLLSLIHQLCCGNLRDQMELKISFLQEAINHLNLHDQTIIEHGGNIVGMLVKKLSALMETPLSVAEDNRVQALCRSALELSVKLPVPRNDYE